MKNTFALAKNCRNGIEYVQFTKYRRTPSANPEVYVQKFCVAYGTKTPLSNIGWDVSVETGRQIWKQYVSEKYASAEPI